MKGLLRRKPTTPKKIRIEDEDFYTAVSAAAILGFSRQKLVTGLKSGRFNFKYGTIEDVPNAVIYVSVRDVEVFIRMRTLRVPPRSAPKL